MQWGHDRLSESVVEEKRMRSGRCKLDPGLKAPPVSKFDCDKDNTAFNLNLVSELAPLHWGGGR